MEGCDLFWSACLRSQDSLGGTQEIRLTAGRPRKRGLVSGKGKRFSFFIHSSQIGSGTQHIYSSICNGVAFSGGKTAGVVQLTNYINLVQRTKMTGATPPLLHTPWRGQGQLSLLGFKGYFSDKLT